MMLLLWAPITVASATENPVASQAAVVRMEPVESMAPMQHSTPPTLFFAGKRDVAPLREGDMDRPAPGDVSEMSDSKPMALRRRWYPYGGYAYYPQYPYHPYGGLDVELGLGLHLGL
ncbi:hypothetical protein GGI02_005096 [Coemansia sp. RSA 2322]|uniref:Uncharacterized protein n=1 Tax=Coemansia thaxteri TaxID=2663907 RepID=A0A9W8BJ33_9FUNG|nr:hypothetical protein H4R26_003413 [Coemansia thaxteri]KAJ2464017.1 hypothetical protein GGI02_005096 [Coemansia sp. RSA 2322]KAJ2476118.1 hypothetical protein EV174_005037 [Coemansia sp. RSA 2320]